MKRWGIPIGVVVGGAVAFTVAADIASAHQGIPPGQTPLTAWGFITNPVPSLFLLASLYFYINGLNNWRNPTHPVNNWQKASFFSGIVVLFAALQSPMEPLAEHYFAIHQLQHLLVRMVGPLLILLGAPLTPMLRGMPTWLRQGVIRRLVRTLGRPLDLRQDHQPGVHDRRIFGIAVLLADSRSARPGGAQRLGPRVDARDHAAERIPFLVDRR